MLIRKVETSEFDKLWHFYDDMIKKMPEVGMSVGWIMEVYPTTAMLKEQLSLGNVYAAVDGDAFAGAMIVNREYNEGYGKASWTVDAKPGEFSSIHLLGVLPLYHHKGIAMSLTNKAIEVSKEQGLKAVRLDVIDGNNPARHLYEKCGFSYVGDVELYYDDCGLLPFYLYEFKL